MSEGLTFPQNPSDGQTISFSFQHTGGDANNAVVTKTWSWNASRNAWVSNSGSGGGGGGGEPIDTSVFVLNTGDEMTGSLVFTGNGKTAEFNSSGITLQADPSSFNIVAQNSYNNGYAGFDAANQKVINIDSSTNAGLWGGFNVKNQLAVGPETLYLNKGKPAAQPTYVASDAYLGGGVAGNSYPEEQIRFTETDMDFKYPSSTHVRKIINKNSQVPVWINGNTQRWLTTNLSTAIGNFSDAGPIRELAKGVITHHGRLFRSPETFENNTYTTVGSFTYVPDFTNDGFYLVGYQKHNTQLILGGYNKVGGETRMKLIYQPRPSYLSYDGNVYVDQVGGQIPRNLIEEKEYGLTTNPGERKTAVLYTVNGIEPPLFYSGGLTSVGATAAIVVGFIDDQGEAWESEPDNVQLSNIDPICQSPQVLFSYNMEKAQNNPSAGDFIDPNSYVDLFTRDDGIYQKTHTIDRINYPIAIGGSYNNLKFVVKDTLVENFGNWSRLWNVYDHPVNEELVANGDVTLISAYVFHPETIAIKYDTSDNRWKRGKLDNHTGVITGDSGTTFRLCYSPGGMTSPWVDGINPAKSHYSFVTKGDEYYCDMDGAGATYYYNVYAGGYFDYKYNPNSIYEKAPINPCFNGKWQNTNYPGLLDNLGSTEPSDQQMCDNFQQYADQMNYKFPFVIYYKVRMSDGRIMDGPISAKLPIFDYDNSNVNQIKIDYNPRPYGAGNESAPIYNFYATPYIGNVINQMCANACVESYDYTVEKKMLNVFGGSVNVNQSNPSIAERSTAFAIRCSIGLTGTLEGGLTQDSDVRWRGMAEGLHWPGYPNIYTATNIGPLYRHRVPQYVRYDEIGHSRCLMIGGVINDYVGRGSHSWQFPRGHLVRWSGYSYDNRDGAGLNVWTSTSPTFLNWQYLRKIFGTLSQGTLSDREWPNMEMLSRVGYNTNMGHAHGTTGNPRGAILSVPFALAQKIFETGLYTNTINPPSTQRQL